MAETIEVYGDSTASDDNVVRVTKGDDGRFWITTLNTAAPSDYETTALTREGLEELISRMVDLL